MLEPRCVTCSSRLTAAQFAHVHSSRHNPATRRLNKQLNKPSMARVSISAKLSAYHVTGNPCDCQRVQSRGRTESFSQEVTRKESVLNFFCRSYARKLKSVVERCRNGIRYIWVSMSSHIFRQLAVRKSDRSKGITRVCHTKHISFYHLFTRCSGFSDRRMGSLLCTRI